jgi:hypothetical protein
MLNVQKYLNAKSLDELNAEFAIKTTFHSSLPLVILNYNQIESTPKTHPIIRECRALILNTSDWSLVARSFFRFFNWGEVQDEQDNFDFSDFTVQSKEDGSLALLYFFAGEWHGNTRGSFALDNMEFQNFTWRDAFCQGMGVTNLSDLNGKLDESICYICEFCSPWNKIVRRYDEPQMYLLTAFRGIDELSPEEVDGLTTSLFVRPERYNFCSIEEIQKFLQEQEVNDATFEGVVIRDRHGNRWKIKNLTYLSLHRLKGEGNNLFNPKHLLPFILSGEKEELILYFPEVQQTFEECERIVAEHFNQLLKVWELYYAIPVQKDFALAIIGKTPFASLLFQLRKDPDQSADQLKKLWRESADLICKIAFKTPACEVKETNES